MNLLSITDINVSNVLGLAKAIKASPASHSHALEAKTLAAIFEKPSTRTKLSFEVAIAQLGGTFVDLNGSHMLNGHEDAHDTANTVAQYANFLLARVHSHSSLETLAAHSPIPVINGLSDVEHPCQALADLLTIDELKGLAGTKVAFIGDANNVCNSLLLGCAMTGINIAIASPVGYGPKAWVLEKAAEYAKASGTTISLTHEPAEAAKDADVVYSDVWVSMGEEKEIEKKSTAFKGFKVTKELMAFAKPNAIFMHCLPAQKGVEVEADVIEGPQSAVFQQAANRLHVQKAVLLMLADTAMQKVANKPGVKK